MAGLRAVRLLHDLEVDNKKLVAKVDAKNKLLLDNYKEEETKKMVNSGTSGKFNDNKINTGDSDTKYLDSNGRRADEVALERISTILAEHKDEIQNYDLIQEGMAKGNTFF